tara:strand:+ start:161 stop:619 length:459 start_codon:yes stop_codon:yes gene_type:complete
MKQILLILAVVTLAVACGPSAKDKAAQEAARKAEEERRGREAAVTQAKDVINSRYSEGVDAILADNFEAFKAITDSKTQAAGAKIRLTWGALRILVGLGGLKKEDFRIDEITLNNDLTLGTVSTSHREKGEWKRGDKPQIWIVENGEWHWKL